MVTIIWQNIEYLNSKRYAQLEFHFDFCFCHLNLVCPCSNWNWQPIFSYLLKSFFPRAVVQRHKNISLERLTLFSWKKIFRTFKDPVIFFLKLILLSLFLALSYIFMAYAYFINYILTLICKLNVAKESLYWLETYISSMSITFQFPYTAYLLMLGK